MGGREAGDPGDRGGASTVCDASPLIALGQLGRLDLLRGVFGTVAVPPAVVAETPRIVKPAWLGEVPLHGLLPPRLVAARLGPGETEAIALALELEADQIILDERRAIRLAHALGLRVVGTLGVLLLAKSRGLLPAVRPVIDDLLGTGFYLAPWVVAAAVAATDEEP